jgi:hypothetical protein
MTKDDNGRLSLRVIISIFIAIFIAVAFYLFYSVLECVRDFGGYAEACDDGFSLFLVPFTIFSIVWGTILIISIAVAVSKRKK